MNENLKKDNGLVIAVHRERYEIFDGNKKLFARLKMGIYGKEDNENFYPCVGDNIEFEYNPTGDSLIVKTLERKSCFSRLNPTPGMGEQIVAVNFDYVFIMMSLNFDFNIKRVERYLATAWNSGATPVIILTKVDIATDIEDKLELIHSVSNGVDVICISSLSGEGIDELNKYLQPDKTIVFLGSSGVGKSTLTNSLLGEDYMLTKGIRETDSKGHHTTTYRQLLFLENGARIIDTPGMREIGMWDVSDGTDISFDDVSRLFSKCRFPNCTHTNEPGCAVIAALDDGTLSKDRWMRYNKLQKEIKFNVGKKKSTKKNSSKTKSKVRHKIDLRNQEW